MNSKNILAEISNQLGNAEDHKAHTQNYIKSKSEVIKAAAEAVTNTLKNRCLSDFSMRSRARLRKTFVFKGTGQLL